MTFIPGVTPIPASTAVIEAEEKAAMHAVIDKGWLTAGPVNAAFEAALGKFTGHSEVRTVNSGSSANLVAVATMVEAGIWKKGDEIITAACAFPTTVNPLLLYGLVPVFVDVDIPTYNVTQELFDAAITPKTRGLMLAHTLGNPFRIATDLPIIEDCCDALGALIKRESNFFRGQMMKEHVGHQGKLATCSFFPAHHITTGEGGAVFTNDYTLAKVAESVRDWGRDCWCQPGQENTCGKRYDWSWENLPTGFDHKYTYTHLGFNLKITDVQAACGNAQLGQLDGFIATRRRNHDYLLRRLSHLGDSIMLPRATEGTNPSWFGFTITIRETGQRTALQQYLDSYKIGSRLVFSGNITRQPYMRGREYRISGSLSNSDKILADSLWIGCHPHLSEEMLDFVASKIEDFFT